MGYPRSSPQSGFRSFTFSLPLSQPPTLTVTSWIFPPTETMCHLWNNLDTPYSDHLLSLQSTCSRTAPTSPTTTTILGPYPSNPFFFNHPLVYSDFASLLVHSGCHELHCTNSWEIPSTSSPIAPIILTCALWSWPQAAIYCWRKQSHRWANGVHRSVTVPSTNGFSFYALWNRVSLPLSPLNHSHLLVNMLTCLPMSKGKSCPFQYPDHPLSLLRAKPARNYKHTIFPSS